MRPLLVLFLVVGAIGALLLAVTGLIGTDPQSELAPGGVETVARTEPGETVVEGGRLTAPEQSTRSGATPLAAETGSGGSAAPVSASNTVVGRVVDSRGNGVGGAIVTLEDAPLGGLFGPPTNDVPANRIEIHTAGDGGYVLRNIPGEITYMATARHPDYSRAQLTGITIKEGRTEMPDLVLGPGSRLFGMISDTGGNPVPEATVSLESRRFYAEDRTDPDRVVVQSDAAGNYEFTNASNVHGHLRVEADGYGTKSITVRYKPGENKIDVQLVVALEIHGIVFGPGDAPIPDARIMGMKMPATHETSMDETRSGPDGRFVLAALEPGSYSLSISAQGYKQVALQRVEAGDHSVTVRLNKRATISGRVLALDTGAPIPTGSVRLRRVQQNSDITSPTQSGAPYDNPDGKYEIDNVPRGSYVVEARAPGFAPTYSSSFTVLEGQPVPGIDVRLTRGGSIAGRVVDGKGAGLGGARVSTHDNTWTDDAFTRSLGDMFPTDATSRTVTTRGDGTFEITGLTPATYQLRVNARGFADFIRQDLRVADGQEVTTGDLTVQRGGSVSGTVYGSDGKPAAGIDVRLVLANRDRSASRLPQMFETISDAKGRYEVQNVPPGDYDLRAIQRMRPRGGTGDPLIDNPLQLRDAQASVSIKDSFDLTQDLRLGS